VSNTEVAKIVDLHSATVGLTTPFFADVGLLRKTPDGLVPAAEVSEFTRAHEWNPETAFHRLAPLLKHAWFFTRLLPKLRFRALSRNEALQELALEAEAAPAYRGQLDTLLDYLAAAGLVATESDQVRLLQRGTTDDAEPAAQSDPRDRDAGHPSHPHSPVATAFANPAAGIVQFNINVKVDVSEFAGWDPSRISAFFAGIAQVLAAKGAIEERASGAGT
jgi:hypothetical protein